MKRTLLLVAAVAWGFAGCSKSFNPASLPGPGDQVTRTQMVRTSLGLCFLQDPEWLGTEVYVAPRGRPMPRIELAVGADLKRIVPKKLLSADYPTATSLHDYQIRRLERRKPQTGPYEYVALKQLEQGVAILTFSTPGDLGQESYDAGAWEYIQRWWDSVRDCGPPRRETFLPSEESILRTAMVPLPENLDSPVCPQSVRSGIIALDIEEHVGTRGAVRCIYREKTALERSMILTAPVLDKTRSFHDTVDNYLKNDEFMTTNLTLGLPGFTFDDICTIHRTAEYVYAECHADEGFRDIAFVRRDDRIQVTAVGTGDTDMVSRWVPDDVEGVNIQGPPNRSFGGAWDPATIGEPVPPGATPRQPTKTPCPNPNWC